MATIQEAATAAAALRQSGGSTPVSAAKLVGSATRHGSYSNVPVLLLCSLHGCRSARCTPRSGQEKTTAKNPCGAQCCSTRESSSADTYQPALQVRLRACLHSSAWGCAPVTNEGLLASAPMTAPPFAPATELGHYGQCFPSLAEVGRIKNHLTFTKAREGKKHGTHCTALGRSYPSKKQSKEL